MLPRALDRLLRQIADTRPEEISCSECFDLLPAAVERDLAGATDAPGHAPLLQHLGQCAVCREEFEALRDLVRATGPDASPPTA